VAAQKDASFPGGLNQFRLDFDIVPKLHFDALNADAGRKRGHNSMRRRSQCRSRYFARSFRLAANIETLFACLHRVIVGKQVGAPEWINDIVKFAADISVKRSGADMIVPCETWIGYAGNAGQAR